MITETHAQRVVQQALISEISRLKTLVPNTEKSRQAIAAIEANSPIHEMSYNVLASYVNLLHRSVI